MRPNSIKGLVRPMGLFIWGVPGSNTQMNPFLLQKPKNAYANNHRKIPKGPSFTSTQIQDGFIITFID